MRMAQNETANVDYEETKVLCVSVKNIVYVNMALYMSLFIGFSHFTFGGRLEVESSEFFVSMVLMLLMLGMCTATCIMHMGVVVERPDYIFPCIIMTVPMSFIFMVYLFYKKNLFLNILLSVCLIYIVLSWYPLYVFYKQFLSKCTNVSAPEPSAPMDDQTVNHTVDTVGYGFRPLPNVVEEYRKPMPPNTAIDSCQSPPSYASVMGVDH